MSSLRVPKDLQEITPRWLTKALNRTGGFGRPICDRILCRGHIRRQGFHEPAVPADA